MGAFRYATTLIFLPLTASAAYVGGWWSFNVPVIAFVLVPLLELAWKGSEWNLSPEEERSALENRIYDAIVYAVVPLQYGVLVYFLWRVSSGQLDALSLVGATLCMGIACGVFGINVGHELGHRKTKFEQRMAKSLLLTSLYTHFFIEHNRGHHKRVATPEDPATARYGETVYRFWLRSMLYGYFSAWQIENHRFARKGQSWFTWRNEMIQYQLLQGAALVGVYLWLGAAAVLAWLAAALLGVLLLESVNYLEHYGLTRQRKDNGRYEHVLPIHSWNSNHPVGRLLLFELTRHSDHHAHASRHYQVLRHFDESPQLPTGYPGMILLALVPPLWFRVMHRHIHKCSQQLTGNDASASTLPHSSPA